MATTGAKKVKSKAKVGERRARRRAKQAGPPRAESTKRWDAPRARAHKLAISKRTRAVEPSNEHEFVDAIIETTGAIIVVMDAAGRIVRFNKASERASGRTAEEVIGAVAYEVLVPAAEREGVGYIFEELRSGRHPNTYENHWRRPDGSSRLIAWSNTSLLGAAGEVQYVVATGIDVTEQRQAEQELLLRQRELVRLRRLHTVGALTALLAHEINQPLAAIASFAEASLGQLRREEHDRRLRRNLTQIVEQVQRAGRSIRELGQFVARGATESGPTDLSTALRSACSLVRSVARARDIRLDYDSDAQLVRVAMPAVEVEQVLFNLLHNAIDAYRDAGMLGGSISVSVRYLGDENRVRVSVEDTGPGVNAKLTKKVFEPLYTTKADGLGLGLPICRSIIEARGGQLWAEAGPGGKFYFNLPVIL